MRAIQIAGWDGVVMHIDGTVITTPHEWISSHAPFHTILIVSDEKNKEILGEL